jgi:DNA (cytosine-5)-methyltransferase 1
MNSTDTNSKQTYNAVSLFSGAMGLDIGLERTGRFRTLAAVEKDESACATIRTNRDAGRTASSELKVIEADVNDITPQEVLEEAGLEPGEVDLLSGGPPCVSFSTAGERRTVQDTRGELIFDFLEFVEHIEPKFFLMENVRGLMSAAINHRPLEDRPKNGGQPLEPDEKPGSVLKLWLRDLADINDGEYRVDIFEVNSANYGAPQIRERVLFIGNRFDTKVEFPRPTHYNVPKGWEPNQDFLEEYTKGESSDKVDDIKPFRTLGDAIKNLEEDDPVIMDFSPRKKKYLEMVPPGGNWRALPEDVQEESMGAAYHASGGRSGWWRRLSYEYPTPTILGQPNHSSSALCHPEEVRALTLRECALVQEFPEDWEFEGTPAEQYKQVGNAVPVTLGRVAGETLAEYLDKITIGDLEESDRELPKARKVYIHSHVRRRYWYKDGDTVVNGDGSDDDNVRYELPETKIKEEVIDIDPERKQSDLEAFTN